MAKTDSDALRGPKLIKKAIEAGRALAFSDPEPVPAGVIKKMALPNGEPVSPSMKELLKVDSLWLGLDFDDEEGDIDSVSLEDLIEEEWGTETVSLFGEACELLSGDCIPIGGASESIRFLYVGDPDEAGEYPVVTVNNDPKPWVGGFVPFDVWVAQELGVVEASAANGAVPAKYEAAQKALATSNGDGRIGFEPKAGAPRENGDESDDEDEDAD